VNSNWLLGHTRFEAPATLGAATWLRALNALDPSATANPAALPSDAPTAISAKIPPAGRFVAAPGKSLSPAPAQPAHETKYGLRSVIYQARRAFVREKFHALLATGLPGVVRAKGFFWIQEQPDEMGFLSLAGGAVRSDFLNYWWATLVETGKAARSDVPEKVERLWHEPHGDRRQELVFIGTDLDEPALRAALDQCLVAT
jgi:G3E family GTPase